MADCFVEWNQDFVIDANGDLLIVDGDIEVRQRLERRLFTAVQGYMWHPEYGAGLPQKIGSVFSVDEIKSICMRQLNFEASVAPYPPAQLTVANDAVNTGIVVIAIKYWDAVSGVTVSFTITL